jgi:RimJ/RimL family protein N-acetyltransferase
MTWYGTELDPPRLLVGGSFLLRPIRAEDAPADHAALMDSRSAVRVHTGSDWPPDDFSEEADRLDLERDAQRHDAREAFTFTVVDAATGAVAGCLYLWPARHQLIRYGVAAQDADRLGSGAAAVELWLRPRLVTAGVDEQMVRAVHGSTLSGDSLEWSGSPADRRPATAPCWTGSDSVGRPHPAARRTRSSCMPDAPSATAAAVFALSGATSVTRTAGAKSRDSAGTGGRRRVHADCPGGRGHHCDGHPTPCRCCRRHRPRAALPPPRHHRDDTPVYEQESLLADCPDPVDRAGLAFAASHPRRCPDALTRSVLEAVGDRLPPATARAGRDHRSSSPPTG